MPQNGIQCQKRPIIDAKETHYRRKAYLSEWLGTSLWSSMLTLVSGQRENLARCASMLARSKVCPICVQGGDR